MHRTTWLVLALVPCSAFAGVRDGVQFDGRFHAWPGFDDPREAVLMTTVTRAVTTPHVAAAVPYVQGPVRVLFIGPRYAARTTVELCQRFDIQDRHALVSRSGGLTGKDASEFFGAPGDSEVEVLAALREGLAASPQVVVLHHFAWRLLPPAVQEQMAAMVRSGVGLVCWNLEEGDSLPKGLEPLAPDAGGAAVALAGAPEESHGRFGALRAYAAPDTGRVLALVDQPSPRRFSYLDDEDLYAVVGRAVLWAAQREPRSPLTVAIDAGSLRVELAGDAPADSAVEVAIYDLGAVLRHELECRAELVPGARWTIPHLKAGPHWLRVTVRSGDKVVDWTTRQLQIAAPVSIESIAIEPEHLEQRGTLRATVRLGGETLDRYELAYRLIDTHDRVLARGQASPAALVALDVAVSDCLSPVCFLVVALQQESRTVVEDRAWFTVAQPPVDAEDFHAALWPQSSAPNHSIWENSLRTFLQRMGIGFVLAGSETPSERNWPVSILNVRPWVYAVNHGNVPAMTEGRGGPAREPCLTSDAYNQASDQTLAERVRNTARFSPVAYTDCGDARLHHDGADVCFSDTCLRDFQAYVQTRYGSLADLNANWDADFQDWSQVTPVTLAELETWKTDPSNPRPASGQYARWVEHRMHMESVWAARHVRDRRVVQALDPAARVGLDALCDYGGSFGGFDFAKMLDFMGVLGPYANSFTLQVSRSLARPGTILGCWVGGGYPHYRTAQYGSATAWMLLFQRYNMQLYFVDYGPTGAGDLCPMFAPDLRPLAVTAEQLEQLQEVQRGTGKLLLSARRENDGIAFLYCPASTHAATLTRGMPVAEFGAVAGVAGSPSLFAGDWIEYVTAHEAMARIFTDLGYQFDYVTSEQMAGGHLAQAGFRLLVLPHAQAFSTEVALEIRRFVDAGGAVLADLRPGLFDGHGRLLDRGQLDDVFGIERVSVEGQRLPEPLKMAPMVPAAGTAALPEMPVDHQVKVDPALALASAPASASLIRHQFGKGHAILLNFYPGRYIALRAKGTERPLLESIGDLLSAAGLEARMRLTAAGSAVPATEIVRFTHGPNEYVGLLRDHRMFFSEPVPILAQEPLAATLDFGRTAHVYDVRAGRYLGERAEVDMTVAPARASLYALLPYRVASLRATEVTGLVAEKQFRLQVLADGDAEAGTHVLRIEVEDASGRSRPEYARNVKLERGAGTFRMPLALSDPEGRWTLSMRDAASGISGRTDFTCRH